MSESSTKEAEIPKPKIRKLPSEVNEFNLIPQDRTIFFFFKQKYDIKLRIIKEKVKHLDFYAGMLETVIQKWLDLIQRTAIASTKKEGKKKYAKMVDDREDTLNLITNTREVVITLKLYSDDYEVIFQRLNQVDTRESISKKRYQQ